MSCVLSLGTILESCLVINLKMTYSDLINLMWSVGKLELKVIVPFFFVINNKLFSVMHLQENI